MNVERHLHYVMNDSISLNGEGQNGENHDLNDFKDDLDLVVPDDIGTPMRTPGHGTPSQTPGTLMREFSMSKILKDQSQSYN